MRLMSNVNSRDLLAVGRRALELGAQRFDEIAQAADPGDQALRDLLRKMTADAEEQAAAVEAQELRLSGGRPESSLLEEGARLIRSYLTSLTRSFGEGPLHRDVALFLAESLEEETSRLCRVLAEHAPDWTISNLFADLAKREQGNFKYLRDVVLVG